MCSPSPPPAPDYGAAATAQGQANIDAARAQGRINNPNVHNPYGDQTVTWNGDTPTLTQTLSPSQQALLDQRNHNQGQLGDLASLGIGNAMQILGSRFDLSGMPSGGSAFTPGGSPSALDQGSLPGMPGAYRPGQLPSMPSAYSGPGKLPDMPQNSQAIRDQVVNAMMSRANRDMDQRSDQTNSDLIARGIRPGTEAYTREQDALNRQRNDAEQQAIIAGGNAADQAYRQDLSTRQQAQQEALDNAGLSYNQGMGVRQQAQGENLANSTLSFGQGMAGRQQAAAEQAQRFGQQGAAEQLRQSQQGQQFGQQQDLRQRAIMEALMRRQMPLNEITALMSGSQVSNPFSMPGYAQNSNVAPAPLFGATQAQGQWAQNAYNQQAGSYNNLMSGLFGLGSAFMGMPH